MKQKRVLGRALVRQSARSSRTRKRGAPCAPTRPSRPHCSPDPSHYLEYGARLSGAAFPPPFLPTLPLPRTITGYR
eukprot:5974600-Alexandrium_andersonii.AAC.1